MKRLKRILAIVGVGVLALIGVIAIKTMSYSADQTRVDPLPKRPVDTAALALAVSEAVHFKTISMLEDRSALPEFQGFLDWLPSAFPTAHATLNREMVNELTPLYTWQGRDPSQPGVILTAHYDVVPIADPDGWIGDPFSGLIQDNTVFGRGTLDDKGSIVAMMTAVEILISEGFQPKQTIYFSFGHDEEIGGHAGASRVVALLQERGIDIAWSLDEGSMILDGIIPGIDRPIASLNIAEKGYLTVDIHAHGEGGHSSMPPRKTAVGELAEGIANLQHHPVKGGLTDVSADMFDALAPHFGLPEKALFANQWLFRPLLEAELSKAVTTDAVLRSTMAPTMLQASPKENVLPARATATVNYRIHPRDSVDGLVRHTNAHLGNDALKVEVRGKPNPPSKVSATDSDAFRAISTTFQQVLPDVIVIPGLTIAATDSIHYSKIAHDSYRILPFIFTNDDIAKFHGKNESISFENLELGVRFYAGLLEKL